MVGEKSLKVRVSLNTQPSALFPTSSDRDHKFVVFSFISSRSINTLFLQNDDDDDEDNYELRTTTTTNLTTRI